MEKGAPCRICTYGDPSATLANDNLDLTLVDVVDYLGGQAEAVNRRS
jgi:hypothetical protein